MTRYSVQPTDKIFVTGYGFLSFAKNLFKIIGNNISKSLNSKYSQKLLDHAKLSATHAFKTSKRVIQKTAEASSDLISNKIANKNIKVAKNSQQNTSETVTSSWVW